MIKSRASPENEQANIVAHIYEDKGPPNMEVRQAGHMSIEEQWCFRLVFPPDRTATTTRMPRVTNVITRARSPNKEQRLWSH
ncbi:hypothetical protein MRX96_050981 [Rhipicephalus microplus]